MVVRIILSSISVGGHYLDSKTSPGYSIKCAESISVLQQCYQLNCGSSSSMDRVTSSELWNCAINLRNNKEL